MRLVCRAILEHENCTKKLIHVYMFILPTADAHIYAAQQVADIVTCTYMHEEVEFVYMVHRDGCSSKMLRKGKHAHRNHVQSRGSSNMVKQGKHTERWSVWLSRVPRAFRKTNAVHCNGVHPSLRADTNAFVRTHVAHHEGVQHSLRANIMPLCGKLL